MKVLQLVSTFQQLSEQKSSSQIYEKPGLAYGKYKHRIGVALNGSTFGVGGSVNLTPAGFIKIF